MEQTTNISHAADVFEERLQNYSKIMSRYVDGVDEYDNPTICGVAAWPILGIIGVGSEEMHFYNERELELICKALKIGVAHAGRTKQSTKEHDHDEIWKSIRRLTDSVNDIQDRLDRAADCLCVKSAYEDPAE